MNGFTTLVRTALSFGMLPENFAPPPIVSRAVGESCVAGPLPQTPPLYFANVDGGVLTLPKATSQNNNHGVVALNGRADGAVGFTVTPDPADTISGTLGEVTASGVQGKSWRNPKSTATAGDFTLLQSNGVDGWIVYEGFGVWESEA